MTQLWRDNEDEIKGISTNPEQIKSYENIILAQCEAMTLLPYLKYSGEKKTYRKQIFDLKLSLPKAAPGKIRDVLEYACIQLQKLETQFTNEGSQLCIANERPKIDSDSFLIVHSAEEVREIAKNSRLEDIKSGKFETALQKLVFTAAFKGEWKNLQPQVREKFASWLLALNDFEIRLANEISLKFIQNNIAGSVSGCSPTELHKHSALLKALCPYSKEVVVCEWHFKNNSTADRMYFGKLTQLGVNANGKFFIFHRIKHLP